MFELAGGVQDDASQLESSSICHIPQAYTRAGGFEVTCSMLYRQRVHLRLPVGNSLACISSWVLEVANAQRKCIFCRCFKILGGVGREQVVGGSKAREDDNIQHPLQESQRLWLDLRSLVTTHNLSICISLVTYYSIAHKVSPWIGIGPMIL